MFGNNKFTFIPAQQENDFFNPSLQPPLVPPMVRNYTTYDPSEAFSTISSHTATTSSSRPLLPNVIDYSVQPTTAASIYSAQPSVSNNSRISTMLIDGPRGGFLFDDGDHHNDTAPHNHEHPRKIDNAVSSWRSVDALKGYAAATSSKDTAGKINYIPLSKSGRADYFSEHKWPTELVPAEKSFDNHPKSSEPSPSSPYVGLHRRGSPGVDRLGSHSTYKRSPGYAQADYESHPPEKIRRTVTPVGTRHRPAGRTSTSSTNRLSRESRSSRTKSHHSHSHRDDSSSEAASCYEDAGSVAKKKKQMLEKELNKLEMEERKLLRKKITGGHWLDDIREEKEQTKALLKIIDRNLYRLHRSGSKNVPTTNSHDRHGKGEKPEPRSKDVKVMQQSSSTKQNIAYRDGGNHWCQECNVTVTLLRDFLIHLKSADHVKKLARKVPPWVSEKSVFVNGGADAILKGTEFLLPCDGFYCELCECFMGDKTEAEIHMKSAGHNEVYKKHKEKYPAYEKKLNERMLEAQRKAQIEKKEENRNEKSHRPQLASGKAKASEPKSQMKSEKPSSKSNQISKVPSQSEKKSSVNGQDSTRTSSSSSLRKSTSLSRKEADTHANKTLAEEAVQKESGKIDASHNKTKPANMVKSENKSTAVKPTNRIVPSAVHKHRTQLSAAMNSVLLPRKIINKANVPGGLLVTVELQSEKNSPSCQGDGSMATSTEAEENKANPNDCKTTVKGEASVSNELMDEAAQSCENEEANFEDSSIANDSLELNVVDECDC